MPPMALIDHPGLVRVMTVQAGSMIPTLQDGDVVLIDMA